MRSPRCRSACPIIPCSSNRTTAYESDSWSGARSGCSRRGVCLRSQATLLRVSQISGRCGEKRINSPEHYCAVGDAIRQGYCRHTQSDVWDALSIPDGDAREPMPQTRVVVRQSGGVPVSCRRFQRKWLMSMELLLQMASSIRQSESCWPGARACVGGVQQRDLPRDVWMTQGALGNGPIACSPLAVTTDVW